MQVCLSAGVNTKLPRVGLVRSHSAHASYLNLSVFVAMVIINTYLSHLHVLCIYHFHTFKVDVGLGYLDCES